MADSERATDAEIAAFRETAYDEGTTSISQRLARVAADWLVAERRAAQPSAEPLTLDVERRGWPTVSGAYASGPPLVPLRDLLREVEWVQPMSNSNPECPICGGRQHIGHQPGCRLAAALASKPDRPGVGARKRRTSDALLFGHPDFDTERDPHSPSAAGATTRPRSAAK